MALPNRHFKIGFNSKDSMYEALMYQKYGYEKHQEYQEVTGLINFVVRGMHFVDDNKEFLVDESAVERLPNGSWTGVVGLLNRSEVDYAPVELLMKEDEYDAMAYNYPYATDEIVFFTKKPEYSPDTMALFRTLSPSVWLSLLACILLVTLACFVAMKKHGCTLGDVLLHVLAISLNQEGNLVPRRAGEGLLLSTWLFAMAVFTLCFKSVLLSFLSFPPVGGVRTVPELAAAIRAGQYVACASYYTGEFESYLQRSSIEDFRVIVESMLKNNGILYFEDLIHQGHEYPFKAQVSRRSSLSYSEGIWYVSKDNMGSLYYATAVRKDFCCKDEMDMLVHRYVAAGIGQKIVRFRNHVLHTSFSDDGVFADDGQDTTRALTTTDISGALIVLVSGHCLSLCVLIIECCVKGREGRRSSYRTNT